MGALINYDKRFFEFLVTKPCRNGVSLANMLVPLLLATLSSPCGSQPGHNLASRSHTFCHSSPSPGLQVTLCAVPQTGQAQSKPGPLHLPFQRTGRFLGCPPPPPKSLLHLL